MTLAGRPDLQLKPPFRLFNFSCSALCLYSSNMMSTWKISLVSIFLFLVLRLNVLANETEPPMDPQPDDNNNIIFPSTDINDVNIFLWTPENGHNHLTVRFNDPDIKKKFLDYQFSNKRGTKILVNGFNAISTRNYPKFVQAYFGNPNIHVNILAVDWYELSKFWYPTAAENAVKVGKGVGELLGKLLVKDMGVDPKSIHVLGHSLGAHLAGQIGRNIETHGGRGKIGRVTALDPASPDFNTGKFLEKVGVNDADLVDVIHTNSGTKPEGCVSIIEPLGHVDFYPNGGQHQPGCYNCRYAITCVFQYLKDAVQFCSHRRVLDLYYESIDKFKISRPFSSRECKNYEAFEAGLCSRSHELLMGEGLDGKSISIQDIGLSKYYLDTNAKPPYSKSE